MARLDEVIRLDKHRAPSCPIVWMNEDSYLLVTWNQEQGFEIWDLGPDGRSWFHIDSWIETIPTNTFRLACELAYIHMETWDRPDN